jgi:hypothetical protein
MKHFFEAFFITSNHETDKEKEVIAFHQPWGWPFAEPSEPFGRPWLLWQPWQQGQVQPSLLLPS